MKIVKLSAIFFIAILMSNVVLGQTEQGNMLIGGGSNLNLSFLNSKIKDDNNSQELGKTINLEITPQIGWFVADGLAIGFELPISYTSDKDTDGDKDETTSIAIGPFLRYYFEGGMARPYLQGSAGIGGMNIKSTFGTSEDEATYSLTAFDLGAGVGLFFNDQVAMDIGISYGQAAVKPSEDNTDNFKFVTSGVGVNIGFSMFF